MTGFNALLKKLLVESRAMLGLSSLALFGLSWFSVYRTTVVLRRMAVDTGDGSMRARGFFRMAGGPNMDFSAGAIEAMTFYWLFLLVPILLTIVWAISRGTASIAGELERGSMDLILSRPVSRTAFFSAQILTTMLGFGFFLLAILAGNLVGAWFNTLDEPAQFWAVMRPALNLCALGMAIFGYTLLFSSFDSVRWRPTLLATTITLAQFIALAIANQPDWDEWKWLNSATVFAAFYPIEAAVKGELLAKNVGILSLVAGLGLVGGFVAFQRRDLPASGG